MRDARARSGGFGESYRVHLPVSHYLSSVGRPRLTGFSCVIAPLTRFAADWSRIVKTRGVFRPIARCADLQTNLQRSLGALDELQRAER